MNIKRIYLEENNEAVYLDAYLADPIADFTRKAILVIPGGGYRCVCADREGEPIAQAFIPYGYQAFVLHYSVTDTDPGRAFPTQLIQASAAMKHIRDHAEEYGIDSEKVFVTGFSAGGHLTVSLGVLWHLPEVYEALDMPYGYNKPTGIMPIYPVVSADETFAHIGSFQNLFDCEQVTEEMKQKASLELHVDEKSAPAFIMHTSNDQAVNVKNSLVLAEAYAKAGHTFELHIYPDAPHGIALGNQITRCGNEKWENKEIAKWVEQAVNWAETI